MLRTIVHFRVRLARYLFYGCFYSRGSLDDSWWGLGLQLPGVQNSISPESYLYKPSPPSLIYRIVPTKKYTSADIFREGRGSESIATQSLLSTPPKHHATQRQRLQMDVGAKYRMLCQLLLACQLVERRRGTPCVSCITWYTHRSCTMYCQCVCKWRHPH